MLVKDIIGRKVKQRNTVLCASLRQVGCALAIDCTRLVRLTFCIIDPVETGAVDHISQQVTLELVVNLIRVGNIQLAPAKSDTLQLRLRLQSLRQSMANLTIGSA